MRWLISWKYFWSTGVDLLLPKFVFLPKNGLKMKKNAIWTKARGVFAFWGIWPSYLGEMDLNPSRRHHPIRAITSQRVLEKSRGKVDDFWRFLAFFGLKRRWKMLILCIVQRLQSNLFWRQFTWYKRPKHWGKDIMGKNKASFVNESRIWLSIVGFQLTMVIKGSGKKLFFTSFWYYNNVEHGILKDVEKPVKIIVKEEPVWWVVQMLT